MTQKADPYIKRSVVKLMFLISLLNVMIKLVGIFNELYGFSELMQRIIKHGDIQNTSLILLIKS